MKHLQHSYKVGVHGRSITTRPGVGGMTTTAHLKCANCRKVGSLKCRAMLPPEMLDQKFIQAGWSTDPNTCPDCIIKIAKDKIMASKPSHAAMKAQAQMFHALSQHFDPDAGNYSAGWSDEKVATEAGLSVESVTEFRKIGFGELKEPPALAALRSDIHALDQLQREHNDGVTKEIAALRTRLMKLSPTA